MAALTPKQALDKAGTSYLAQIAINFEANKVNATGKTRAAIKKNVSDNAMEIVGPPYIRNLETGTPPGTPISQLVPQIMEWARAKGISKRAVYPISKAISIKGSRLYRNEDPRFSKPSGLLTSPAKAVTKALSNDLLLAFRNVIDSDISKLIRDANSEN